MSSFISQKTLSMPLFIDRCAQKFFTEKPVYLHSMDCLFNSGSE